MVSLNAVIFALLSSRCEFAPAFPHQPIIPRKNRLTMNSSFLILDSLCCMMRRKCLSFTDAPLPGTGRQSSPILNAGFPAFAIFQREGVLPGSRDAGPSANRRNAFRHRIAASPGGRGSPTPGTKSTTDCRDSLHSGDEFSFFFRCALGKSSWE